MQFLHPFARISTRFLSTFQINFSLQSNDKVLKSSIYKSALEVPKTQALKKRVSNGSQTLASSTKTWICAFFSSSSSSSSSYFILFILTNQWFMIWKKEEPSESQKPAIVLRTIRFDHGSHGSLLFSHRTVLEAKKTSKLMNSRFFGRTIRSGPDFP